jgi:hypothetical protein
MIESNKTNKEIYFAFIKDDKLKERHISINIIKINK